MSKVVSALLFVNFLLATACSATTGTTSGRFEGGHGPAGGLASVAEGKTPPNIEPRVFDRQADHDTSSARENPTFRIESDCRRCR